MKVKEQRQAYEKPALKVVDLAAEEILSSGCKTESGAGDVGEVPHPVQGCIINGCSSEIGS